MSDLVARLMNWGAVMRSALLPGHCGSAEWRHVQHRGLTEGEEETRRRAKLVLDTLDAWEVELAWRTLDPGDQKLLMYVYIWRSHYPKQLCRRLSISSETVDGCHVYFEIAKTNAHRNMGRALEPAFDGLHFLVENRAS